MKLEPIFTAPPVEEIAERLARVQEKMREHRLDWFACFQPDNVYYLTNFANFVHERPFVLLIPPSGTPRFVVPKLEAAHINSRKVGGIDLVEYFEYPAPAGKAWYDRLKDVLSGSARVGVESACTLEIYDAIDAERVRIDIVDDLRTIKTPYEIGRMVYSANIASTAMEELLANAEPGYPLRKVSASGRASMMGLLMADNPSINPLATRADAIFQPPHYSDDPHNFTDLAMTMVEGCPFDAIRRRAGSGDPFSAQSKRAD